VSLQLIPISLEEANRFVAAHHRHSVPTVGHKFSLGAVVSDEIVGVAIVGRPVARGYQDGWTLEANRVCTDGTRNACSFLYAAAWRATRALGYRRLVTYTLVSESGASLRAAGWNVVGERPARGTKGWNTPSRPRVEVAGQARLCWEAA
jgi:hypothetical protein